MTMATRAPVIIPSMATPNRISSQLTMRPPGEVTKAESPAPRTVAIPQLNESNSDPGTSAAFSSSVISTAAISDHDDDPLGQRQEEAPVELAADAPQVPRHPADDRAGQDRGERHGRHRSTIVPYPGGSTSTVGAPFDGLDGRSRQCWWSGSGIVTSTSSASSARTRSAGARWRLTPKSPPPIATTSSPSIAASAMTGQARVEPNGVIVYADVAGRGLRLVRVRQRQPADPEMGAQLRPVEAPAGRARGRTGSRPRHDGRRSCGGALRRGSPGTRRSPRRSRRAPCGRPSNGTPAASRAAIAGVDGPVVPVMTRSGPPRSPWCGDGGPARPGTRPSAGAAGD